MYEPSETGTMGLARGDIKDLTNQLLTCHDRERKEGNGKDVIGVPEYDLLLAVVVLAAKDAAEGDYQAELWIKEWVYDGKREKGKATWGIR